MVTREPIEHISPGGAVMEASDEILLQQATAEQRDNDAFAALYERHRKRAFNIAYRILRNSALAQDAVQDAMISVWRSAQSALPKGNVEDWIMRIVTNKSIDLVRADNRRAKLKERVAMEQIASHNAMADHVESVELVALLRREIEKFPEMDCQLLTCCYGANMSHRQLAEVFNVSHTTVSNRIQQAVERLRGILIESSAAAAVPLLSSETLRQAVTTGYECPPGMTEQFLKVFKSLRTKAVRPHSRIKVPGSTSMLLSAVAITVVAAAVIWFSLPANRPPKSPAITQPLQLRTVPDAAQPQLPAKDNVLFEDRMEDKLAPWTLDGMKAEHVRMELDGQTVWVLKMSSVLLGRPGYATTKLRRGAPAMAVEYSTLRRSPKGAFRTAMTISEPNTIKPVDPRKPESSAGNTVMDTNRWYRWRIEYYGSAEKGGATAASNLTRTYIDGKCLLELRLEGTVEDSFSINVNDMEVLIRDLRIVEIEPLKNTDRK
jgi:RNA polymerase sigma-70 factor (ECF subfamily)